MSMSDSWPILLMIALMIEKNRGYTSDQNRQKRPKRNRLAKLALKQKPNIKHQNDKDKQTKKKTNRKKPSWPTNLVQANHAMIPFGWLFFLINPTTNSESVSMITFFKPAFCTIKLYWSKLGVQPPLLVSTSNFYEKAALRFPISSRMIPPPPQEPKLPLHNQSTLILNHLAGALCHSTLLETLCLRSFVVTWRSFRIWLNLDGNLPRISSTMWAIQHLTISQTLSPNS